MLQAYNQVFYTPWADSIDLEERHSQLLSQVGFWPVDHTDPSMPVDYAKLFLLCNVFLLSTANDGKILSILFGFILLDPMKQFKIQRGSE